MSVVNGLERGFHEDPFTREVFMQNPGLVDVDPDISRIARVGDVLRLQAAGGNEMPYDFKPFEVVRTLPSYEQGVLVSRGTTRFRLARFKGGDVDPEAPSYLFPPELLAGFEIQEYGDTDAVSVQYAYFHDPEPFKRIIIPTGFAYGVAEGRLAQGTKIRRPSWYLKALQVGVIQDDGIYVWQHATPEAFPLAGVVGLIANTRKK